VGKFYEGLERRFAAFDHDMAYDMAWNMIRIEVKLDRQYEFEAAIREAGGYMSIETTEEDDSTAIHYSLEIETRNSRLGPGHRKAIQTMLKNMVMTTNVKLAMITDPANFKVRAELRSSIGGRRAIEHTSEEGDVDQEAT
jgi:hypothetical protein